MSAHKSETPLRLISIFYYISANLVIKTQKELSVELSFSEPPCCASISIKMRASRRSHRRHSNSEVSIDPSANFTANKCPAELNTKIGRAHHQSSSSSVVCVLMPSTRTCQICLSCRKALSHHRTFLERSTAKFYVVSVATKIGFPIKNHRNANERLLSGLLHDVWWFRRKHHINQTFHGNWKNSMA